ASRANAGVIVLSSTGRNSSASTDTLPNPSADVSSTFGGAISKPRVSVLIDAPSADKIERRMYLPGGSAWIGITFVKIARVSVTVWIGTSTFSSAGASGAVAISNSIVRPSVLV